MGGGDSQAIASGRRGRLRPHATDMRRTLGKMTWEDSLPSNVKVTGLLDLSARTSACTCQFFEPGAECCKCCLFAGSGRLHLSDSLLLPIKSTPRKREPAFPVVTHNLQGFRH